MSGDIAWGAPFTWPETGPLKAVHALMRIHEARDPTVNLLAVVHQDQDGRPGQPLVELSGNVAPGDPAWITFAAPAGEPATFAAGQRLWLVVYSPTGNEVAWLTGEAQGLRYRKDQRTHEESVETVALLRIDAESTPAPGAAGGKS